MAMHTHICTYEFMVRCLYALLLSTSNKFNCHIIIFFSLGSPRLSLAHFYHCSKRLSKVKAIFKVFAVEPIIAAKHAKSQLANTNQFAPWDSK